MAIFMTGATGYLGSYSTEWLLRNTDHELALLVGTSDYDAGVEGLWKSLQLHMEADEFHRHLDRICFIGGDLTEPGLGISAADYDWLISNAESVLHNADALDFRSERACTNQNLRGTLSVIQLARAIQEDHPLERFTLVSTAAVAGNRPGALVMEDEPLGWSQPDSIRSRAPRSFVSTWYESSCRTRLAWLCARAASLAIHASPQRLGST